MALTDTMLRSIKPKTNMIQEIADGHGLYMIVYPSGVKSFVARISFKGRTYRKTLGEYPAMKLTTARAEHAVLKMQAKNGEFVPARQKPALKTVEPVEGITVSEAFAAYMGAKGEKLSRPLVRWRMFERDIEPTLGAKALADVTEDDLDALILGKFEAIVARGLSGKGSNHLHALLSTFFKWCRVGGKARTKLKTNPMESVAKVTEMGNRKRWLSVEELTLLLQAMPVAGDFADPLLLILRSGCRRSEIMNLTKAMVVLEDEKHGAHLFLPATKNGEAQRVPLIPQMVALLPDMDGLKDDEIIWRNSRRHNRPALSPVALSNPKDRIAERMNELNGSELEHWTIHDWRKSFSTIMNDMADTPNGIEGLHIEMCLHHKIKGITGIYNKGSYSRQRRNVLNYWNELLDGLQSK